MVTSRDHAGLDAGSGTSHGPSVHRDIQMVMVNPTPVNSAHSSLASSMSSFEELISELELHHLNATDYQDESPYHTADSFREIFRSKAP